ncbi:MAG: PaaI family thioesterase [Alphaproteobacteria bacterium]|nr:PaaI family thioesterase [Alphaproteobacteria bacterium]
MSSGPNLADRDQRLAVFQQWFSDAIPHNKALGLKVVAVRRGFAAMQLEWREELVGNPETGVLAGGPLTAMLDGCCGMAVATMLKEAAPFATLDLRIDYVKPATPGQAVIAEAECYRITRSVAFTRAFAHHGDAKDPIAAAAGTFMLGTKGQATRPHMAGAVAKP